MIKRMKDWMHWRGVTVKDLVYSAFALCTLGGMIFLLACLLIG